MFADTQPAEFDAGSALDAGPDPWAEFRVGLAQDRLRLLRALRDCSAPVILSTNDGCTLGATLWAVDAIQQRLNFSADPADPHLGRLVDADSAVAVAYLDSVKLQFALHGLLLVRGADSCALHATLPHEIHRFQRRNAYRVRAPDRHTPSALLRHPALPEMALVLRVIDVSIGGCALWLPHDVPPLQPGTLLGEVQIELDAQTSFTVPLALQHVSAHGASGRGARLGCEWHELSGSAARVLQRWIDRTQQRRRLLALS